MEIAHKNRLQIELMDKQILNQGREILLIVFVTTLTKI